MSAKTPVAVGLIGAGRIGQLHAQHLSHRVRGVSLVAVADVRREAATALAQRFNVATVYEDPTRVFLNPDVDAVVICSSTDTHAAFIEQAAVAGKHIFCEKPIDFDLNNIDRALDAVQRAGVKLQIGFNRRFDPSFARVFQAVAEGEIGTPQLLRITSRDPAPPPLDYIKVSGGLFLDMMIHDFDMARYVMGYEVSEVFALGAVLVDPRIGEVGDVDTAVVTLKFENGAIGTIDNSRQALYGYDQRVEVLGSKGMVSVENPLPHQARLARKNGFFAPPLQHFFVERYSDSYVYEMEAFVACVQQDTMPAVTGEDGRAPVVMGRAAQKSLREGRPVLLTQV